MNPANLPFDSDTMLQGLRAWVECESPTWDAGAVDRMLDLAAREMAIMGATIERIVGRQGFAGCVRARFPHPKQGEPGILIAGHLDTVHPVGTLEKLSWRREGNKCYGPGIFDMKANCALALEVINSCVALDLAPRRPVVLLLTCDEETGSLTGRSLVEEEARKAHSVLVLEPSAAGGRVKTARKGTGIFTLEAEGIAAHAGLEPEKGASAILELARQIERLHALNDMGRGVAVNVGVIQGGTRSNVVPAEARAEIDVRFSTAEDARYLEETILGARPFDARVQLRLSGGINRPPLVRTEKVAALYEVARSVAAQLDFDLGETSVGGASDGNFAAALDVAVLDGLGVMGDGAHAMHEHILTEDITRRGALLTGIIASL